MADGEQTIENAAHAQARRDDGLGLSAAVVRKSSPRRRVVSSDQTSLSTGAAPILPAVITSKSEIADEVAAEAEPVEPTMVDIPSQPVQIEPMVAGHEEPTLAASITEPELAHSDSQVAPDQGSAGVSPPQETQPVSSSVPSSQPIFRIEDMTMDMSANFSTFQSAMADAQTKAQAAFEKSTSMLGETSEFAKGNVEAMMASGKIFAEGVQEIGGSMVAEGRTAFESMTGDIKELAAAKSPTDFLKLQGDIVRKSFDSAVAYGSKNSETFLKLMNDAFAPLSGRVGLAVEKARQAAPMNVPVNTPAL